MSAIEAADCPRLSRALTRLAFDQPFFGTLVAMTPVVEDRDLEAMSTNGQRVYYNPTFLESLTDDEALGVLVHELMHIVYLHCDPARRGGREPRRWNVAGDYAINQELVSRGFSLPKGALLSRRYSGLCTEEIYELLPAGSTLGCLEDHLIEMPAEARGCVQGRVLTAAAVAGGRGELPGDLPRWISRLRASRVPWRRLLRAFAHDVLTREEQSFLPPNRRHLWDERYLPATRPGKRCSLVVAVDTSGSIGDAQLTAFAAEMKAIASICDEALAITCDAKVHEAVATDGLGKFLAKLKFTGRGGTDFRPVFNHIAKLKPPPDALIYLTDGDGEFPKTPPRGYHVLWCLTEPVEVPWGRTLLLDEPMARGGS